MIQHMKLRSNRCKNGPLFIWHSDDNLTRDALSLHTLKHLATAAGMDPSHFSSHSFRIGAATTAAAVVSQTG